MTVPGQLAFAIAAGIAIIPSAGVIYYSLKNVYHLLDDRKLYFMLGMSLLTGVSIALFQTYIVHDSFYAVRGGSLLILIAVALLFSMFDNLLKIVLLNLKRYRTQMETTFYGMSFALMGAMVSALHGFRFFEDVELFPVQNETGFNMTTAGDYYSIPGFFVLIFAAVFYHGAMGVFNGYYSSIGRFWSMSHMGKAVAYSFPFNFFLFWWFILGDMEVLVAGLVYSLIILYVIVRKYFPIGLPPGEQKDLMRHFPWKTEDKRENKGLMARLREIEEDD